MKNYSDPLYLLHDHYIFPYCMIIIGDQLLANGYVHHTLMICIMINIIHSHHYSFLL
jgi:hypothetical protein